MAEPLYDKADLKAMIKGENTRKRTAAASTARAQAGNARNTAREAKASQRQAAANAQRSSAAAAQQAAQIQALGGKGQKDSPIIPVAMIVIGAYLAWFGIHYWSSDTKWPSDPIKALLTTGKIPKPDTTSAEEAIANVPKVLQAGGSGAAAGLDTAAGIITGNQLADAALKYKGDGYVFGGPADKPGNWDCSSFVSYVLGHDLGHVLPGGGKFGDAGYPPHTHGPTTLTYMLFGTAVSRSAAQAGDLVVSSEHMGILISSTQYVSARTPALGVGVDNLSDPFPGGSPVFRRVT